MIPQDPKKCYGWPDACPDGADWTRIYEWKTPPSITPRLLRACSSCLHRFIAWAHENQRTIYKDVTTDKTVPPTGTLRHPRAAKTNGRGSR